MGRLYFGGHGRLTESHPLGNISANRGNYNHRISTVRRYTTLLKSDYWNATRLQDRYGSSKILYMAIIDVSVRWEALYYIIESGLECDASMRPV